MIAPNAAPTRFPAVGFSGSRRLAGPAALQAAHLAQAVETSGSVVYVGDAAGADQAVRAVARDPRVFRVHVPGPAGLVDRSASLVRALSVVPGSVLVGFPDCPCPPALCPAALPARCFCGLGSGTWASLALAVGLGVPVRVFLPDSTLPPRTWGPWRLETAGPFDDSWALDLSPRPAQLRLF